jgi:hypothetical protein
MVRKMAFLGCVSQIEGSIIDIVDVEEKKREQITT